MTNFDVDPEAPRGFADADFEMAGLEATAHVIAQARAKGQCAHGWRQGLGGGLSRCLDCGLEATTRELDRARRAILEAA